MNPLWFWSDSLELLGWTLLHFVWQGGLLGLGCALLLTILRRSSAQTRYIIACSGLLMMSLCPLITYACLGASSQKQITEAIPFSAPISSVGEPGPNFVAPTLPPTEPKPFASAKTLETLNVEPLRSWLPWLVWGWFAGVLSLSLKLVVDWIWVQRTRSRHTQNTSSDWQDRLQQLANRMGLTRRVRILESSIVDSPIMIGWIRPLILLPGCALTGLTPRQLESILAHELAHVRRHDYLVNLIQTVLETLLFYHPAVWWISRVIRTERETCCDEIAVEICGDRKEYAKALTALEELRHNGLSLAMAATNGSLLDRIRRIMGMAPLHSQAQGSAWWIMTTIVLLSLSAFIMNSSAEDNPQPQPQTQIAADKPKPAEPPRIAKYETSKRFIERNEPEGYKVHVLTGVKVFGEREALVDMGYSTANPRSFLPADVVKRAGGKIVGRIDLGKEDPLSQGLVGLANANPANQKVFDIARLEWFDIGVGPPSGPVEALVLSEGNPRIGVIGRDWARAGARGKIGYIHAADDDTLYYGRMTVREDKSVHTELITAEKLQAELDKGGFPAIVYGNSRESRKWVKNQNGSLVPVDEGIEWDGFKYYLTMLWDVVAVDPKTDQVAWEASVGAFYNALAIVEVTIAGKKQQVLEVHPGKSNQDKKLNRYFHLKTGQLIQLPEQIESGLGQPLKARINLSGDQSLNQQPKTYLVNSPEDWTKLLKTLWSSNSSSQLPKPQDIDFSKEVVLVIASAYSNNCVGFTAQDLFEAKDRVIVRIRASTVQTSSFGNDDLDSPPPFRPWGVMVLPRIDKPYSIEMNQQRFIGGPPIWKEQEQLPKPGKP